MEASSKINGVLKEPKPYVWTTNFQSYAVEYVLYVFINDIKRSTQNSIERFWKPVKSTR